MGGSCALLNPIQWDEPFGFVMIEAIATGTPVVATRAGRSPRSSGRPHRVHPLGAEDLGPRSVRAARSIARPAGAVRGAILGRADGADYMELFEGLLRTHRLRPARPADRIRPAMRGSPRITSESAAIGEDAASCGSVEELGEPALLLLLAVALVAVAAVVVAAVVAVVV